MHILYTLYNRLRTSDIVVRLAKGSFWSFTGTAAGKFFVLLTGIICARILGKEMFGELGIVRSTFNMFIVVGASGIGVTATRYISAYRKSDPGHAASIYRLSTTFSLVIGIIIAILLLCASGILSDDYLHSPNLTTSLAMGSIILLICTMNSTENGTLAGMEDFRAIAINTLISSIIESVCMIIGAWLYRIEGAVAGFGLGVLSLYLLNKRSAIKALKRNGITTDGRRILPKDWQLIYKYSIPATLSAMTVTPVFWLLRSMLVRHNGYGDLGVFEAADQWKIVIQFIPTAVCQITLPILSSIDDNRKFSRTLMGILLLIGGISAFLALVTLAAAPLLMPLYGNAFTNNTPLAILALSTIPTAIALVLEMMMYSRDKMWTCLLFNIIWGTAVILFSYYYLMKGKGAESLALAILLAYLIKMALMGIYFIFMQNKRTSK